MTPRKKLTSRLRQGFSMVEILVAMTILTVIVLIVSVVFQQTSLAWSIGLRRAEAQSATRAVVGALSRDLAMMVDPCNFVIAPAEGDSSAQEQALKTGLLDAATGEMSSSLDFWILRPVDTSTINLTDSSISGRELVHVKYTFGSTVKREETAFDSNGDQEPSRTSSTDFRLDNGGIQVRQAENNSTQGFTSFYDVPGIELTVKPNRPVDVNDYEIAVGSKGPDRQWGTKDDIRPWVDGEDQ